MRTKKKESKTEKLSFVTMDLDVLEKKIKKLVNKLKKSNIHLEVFDADDIEYGVTLGKGGEGLVQCAMVRYNGLRIKAAVKTVLNNSDDSLSLTFDEIELLCLARDPIVTTTIQVYGVAAVPDDSDPEMGHLVIITEAGLMNALQLYQSETIPLHVTYDIWSHLAAALHCIHTKRIIHQDLKPENILVTGIFRDMDGQIDKVQVKVIDLGMARLLEGDSVYTDDVLGTVGYHSPEVLFDDCYDFRADIFVLGITFCVLLLPRSSLKKQTLINILKRIHEGKERKFVGSGLFHYYISSLLANNNSLISSDIRNLICSMLESVDKRSVSLLDVSSKCHKESVLLRQQQLTLTQSDNTGRLYHQDSGIDSSEYAIISDVATKRNTRSNAGRAAKTTPTKTKEDGKQTKKKTTPTRRRTSRARLASSSTTGSETNSSRSADDVQTTTSNTKKSSSKTRKSSTSSAAASPTPTTSQDEPVCRRTRSAKRPHDDPVDDASPNGKGKGGSVKKPPAKRMLRSKS